MSHNFSASQPLYTLSLCTRPGIAIRLLNSNLKEITRGSGKLETKQPEGLYLVQWSSGGLQSETMVRLDGSQEITELRFDPSDTATDTAPHSGDHIALALIDAVSNALEPIKGSQESTIVLIVTGDAEPLNDISALRLRLFDRNDVAMRRDSGRFIKLDLGSDERAYIYHVKPGRFHIGFQSILKERLGQSVPALAGRQTLIFLTAARAKLIVPNNGKFVKEVGIGIDPAKTVIVTVRGDEEKYRVRERVRLASLLLYDIANQTNSLSRDVVSVLDDNQTDPMLRLYGALVALSTLKRDERSRISHESNLVGNLLTPHCVGALTLEIGSRIQVRQVFQRTLLQHIGSWREQSRRQSAKVRVNPFQCESKLHLCLIAHGSGQSRKVQSALTPFAELLRWLRPPVHLEVLLLGYVGVYLLAPLDHVGVQ